MTRGWTAPPCLMLLLVLLNGCGLGDAYDCLAPANIHCSGSPLSTSTPFMGTWLNEQPQPGQVTRINVYSRMTEGYPIVYTQIWESCGSEECALEESGGALATNGPDGRKIALLTYGSYEDDPTKKLSVLLTLLSRTRAQGDITLIHEGPSGSEDVRTDTYYFYKAQR